MEKEDFDTPDADIAFGITRVLPWLWLGGEEDIDFEQLKVDVWIDFRQEMRWNRRIWTPKGLTIIKMPFQDGDLFLAESILPLAKLILSDIKEKGKKALISCHAGVSRSALLALWVLSEELGFEKAWLELKRLRPIVEINPNLLPLIQKLMRYDQEVSRI